MLQGCLQVEGSEGGSEAPGLEERVHTLQPPLCLLPDVLEQSQNKVLGLPEVNGTGQSNGDTDQLNYRFLRKVED